MLNYLLMDENLNTETIGQRLARLRKEKALTQIALAERIGISQSTLTDYERGKLRLHDNLILKIAEVLKISTDELLGKKSNKTTTHISSLRISRRLKEIEELAPADQKALLRNIDLFIQSARKRKVS
jgi:transcriptional regulator with XRE-family HTH domain